MSAEAGQFSRWGRGARLTRRVREEYRVYFDRNATQNAAKRSGSAGMDRRSNAAWVLPQAVQVDAPATIVARMDTPLERLENQRSRLIWGVPGVQAALVVAIITLLLRS